MNDPDDFPERLLCLAGHILYGMIFLVIAIAVEPIVLLVTGKTYEERHLPLMSDIDSNDPGVDVDE